MNDARPTIWQMVKEAVAALGGSTTNVAIREWIMVKYPGTKPNSIACCIIAGTVNQPSRVHHNIGARPRRADDPNNDCYFRPQRGAVEFYNPERHGVWEIYKTGDETLSVRQVDAPEDEIDSSEAESGGCFAEERHLRDYLAQHLDQIEPHLRLFVDEDGNPGVEYITPVGRIDLLAVDSQGGLVVIELKVSRGPDSVAGQILRYKNWVKRNLANGRKVRGIIIAAGITDHIRYAIADDPEISAREYEIRIALRPVSGL